MGEALEVARYNLDILYESENEPLIVNNNEVGRVQRRRFRFRADKEFLRSCLAYGATAVAIGATAYFLKDKFSVLATPIAANSVIYEVVVPKKTRKNFEDLVHGGTIQSSLQNVFDNFEKSIEHVLEKEWQSVLPEKEMSKLRGMKISSVKLCSQEEVDTAMENLEDELGTKELKQENPPPPPENLRVKENPQSPSTSVLVFFECPKERDLQYKVVAQSLDEHHKTRVVETREEYAVVRDLDPGQSYLIWVLSVKDGLESTKTLLKEPIRTALYDPFPWRSWEISSKAPSAIDSAYGTSASKDDEAVSSIGQKVADEESEDIGDPPLWKSDLHLELSKILRIRFPAEKMKRLLFKCDELGIVEANDLKYLDDKEITDQLKGTIKPVEILKLISYAKDQHSMSTGTSDASEGRTNNVVYNITQDTSGYVQIHR